MREKYAGRFRSKFIFRNFWRIGIVVLFPQIWAHIFAHFCQIDNEKASKTYL